ncbi:hypothetical protein QBC44DRAFT_391385 [Cladorrhinum sp. PSN332]|nr:hypothetical protein QBC44DRAFT_391385 [Cladorrhinum sp. PSN332]
MVTSPFFVYKTKAIFISFIFYRHGQILCYPTWLFLYLVDRRPSFIIIRPVVVSDRYSQHLREALQLFQSHRLFSPIIMADAAQKAEDEYNRLFPYGHRELPTSAEGLLCGIRAIRDSLAEQCAFERLPDEYFLGFTTHEDVTRFNDELGGQGRDNENNFFIDQLAAVVDLVGKDRDPQIALQLAVLRETGTGRVKQLLPTSYENPIVVWIFHSGTEVSGHYQGMAIKPRPDDTAGGGRGGRGGGRGGRGDADGGRPREPPPLPPPRSPRPPPGDPPGGVGVGVGGGGGGGGALGGLGGLPPPRPRSPKAGEWPRQTIAGAGATASSYYFARQAASIPPPAGWEGFFSNDDQRKNWSILRTRFKRQRKSPTNTDGEGDDQDEEADIEDVETSETDRDANMEDVDDKIDELFDRREEYTEQLEDIKRKRAGEDEADEGGLGPPRKRIREYEARLTHEQEVLQRLLTEVGQAESDGSPRHHIASLKRQVNEQTRRNGELSDQLSRAKDGLVVFELDLKSREEIAENLIHACNETILNLQERKERKAAAIKRQTSPEHLLKRARKMEARQAAIRARKQQKEEEQRRASEEKKKKVKTVEEEAERKRNRQETMTRRKERLSRLDAKRNDGLIPIPKKPRDKRFDEEDQGDNKPYSSSSDSDDFMDDMMGVSIRQPLRIKPEDDQFYLGFDPWKVSVDAVSVEILQDALAYLRGEGAKLGKEYLVRRDLINEYLGVWAPLSDKARANPDDLEAKADADEWKRIYDESRASFAALFPVQEHLEIKVAKIADLMQRKQKVGRYNPRRKLFEAGGVPTQEELQQVRDLVRKSDRIVQDVKATKALRDAKEAEHKELEAQVAALRKSIEEAETNAEPTETLKEELEGRETLLRDQASALEVLKNSTRVKGNQALQAGNNILATEEALHRHIDKVRAILEEREANLAKEENELEKRRAKAESRSAETNRRASEALRAKEEAERSWKKPEQVARDLVHQGAVLKETEERLQKVAEAADIRIKIMQSKIARLSRMNQEHYKIEAWLKQREEETGARDRQERLDEREATLNRRAAALNELENQLNARQREIDERAAAGGGSAREDADARTNLLNAREETLNQRATILEGQANELTQRQEALGGDRAQLTTDQEAYTNNLAALAAAQETLTINQTAYATDRAQLTNDLEGYTNNLAALTAAQATLADNQAALANHQAAFAIDRAQLDTDRAAYNRDLAVLNTAQNSLTVDRQALDTRQAALNNALNTLNLDRATYNTDRDALDRERRALGDRGGGGRGSREANLDNREHALATRERELEALMVAGRAAGRELSIERWGLNEQIRLIRQERDAAWALLRSRSIPIPEPPPDRPTTPGAASGRGSVNSEETTFVVTPGGSPGGLEDKVAAGHADPPGPPDPPGDPQPDLDDWDVFRNSSLSVIFSYAWWLGLYSLWRLFRDWYYDEISFDMDSLPPFDAFGKEHKPHPALLGFLLAFGIGVITLSSWSGPLPLDNL